jgi:hypothetical protein
VALGPVGVGEDLHQVFADFDDPVHGSLQGSLFVGLFNLPVGRMHGRQGSRPECAFSHWNLAPAGRRRYISRGIPVKHGKKQ